MDSLYLSNTIEKLTFVLWSGMTWPLTFLIWNWSVLKVILLQSSQSLEDVSNRHENHWLITSASCGEGSHLYSVASSSEGQSNGLSPSVSIAISLKEFLKEGKFEIREKVDGQLFPLNIFTEALFDISAKFALTANRTTLWPDTGT